MIALAAILAVQQPSPPSAALSPPPAAVFAIRAGTLIDGSGAAPVKNAVIVIQGDRITAVGANVAVPTGATVVDLSTETLLPGFNDAHVHLAGRTIANIDEAAIAELPAEPRDYLRQLRQQYVTVQERLHATKSHHVADALSFAGRAWRRRSPITSPSYVPARLRKPRGQHRN